MKDPGAGARLPLRNDIVVVRNHPASQFGAMNAILQILVDLLGEVFPVANPTPASGRPMGQDCRRLRCRTWWRRTLGIGLFVLLAALPFLLLRWL